MSTLQQQQPNDDDDNFCKNCDHWIDQERKLDPDWDGETCSPECEAELKAFSQSLWGGFEDEEQDVTLTSSWEPLEWEEDDFPGAYTIP